MNDRLQRNSKAITIDQRYGIRSNVIWLRPKLYININIKNSKESKEWK